MPPARPPPQNSIAPAAGISRGNSSLGEGGPSCVGCGEALRDHVLGVCRLGGGKFTAAEETPGGLSAALVRQGAEVFGTSALPGVLMPTGFRVERDLAARADRPRGVLELPSGKYDVIPPAASEYEIPKEDRAAVLRLVTKSWADNTWRAYVRAWDTFALWCLEAGRTPLIATPATVALFLEKNAHLSIPVLTHVLAAIRAFHSMVNASSPVATDYVSRIWDGIRREQGVAPKNAKAPIADAELGMLLARVDRTTVAGLRDAALLLVGFHGAFRRSELVAIDLEHLRDTPGGLGVFIPKSKTDQEGVGYVVGLAKNKEDPALCPVAALDGWLRVSKIQQGPVFVAVSTEGHARKDRLNPASVATLVKKYAEAAGLDPKRYAGHSLRAGLVTEAYRQGISEAEIMGTTRHQTATMLARYRREADPVKQGVGAALKLGRSKALPRGG